MVLKTRDLFTAQRTQAVNALRGHLAEYGVIAPTGLGNLTRLEDALGDPKHDLPEVVVALCRRFLDQIEALSMQVNDLTRQVKAMSRKDDTARRLTTIPGVGPICAVALATLAPPGSTFAKGRDFSAWAGLTPKQHSTGGKARLGRTSKMPARYPAVADYWSDVGDSSCREAGRCTGRIVAGANADPQAKNAGHGCLGQQNGAYGMGLDDERRGLPGSARRLTAMADARECGGSERRVMGEKSRMTRSGEPVMPRAALTARFRFGPDLRTIHKDPQQPIAAKRGRTHVGTRPHFSSSP